MVVELGTTIERRLVQRDSLFPTSESRKHRDK